MRAGQTAHRRVFGLVAGAAVMLVCAGVAWADNYTFALTPRDRAAAHAAVLRLSDLGHGGWKGGYTKSDFSAPPTCASYRPTFHDLTLTGKADSQFSNGAMQVTSEASVFKTAAMLRQDLRRSIDAPGARGCLRQFLKDELGANFTIRSFDKLTFAKVAPYTVALRALIDGNGNNAAQHAVIDVVVLGKGRSELLLGVTDVGTTQTLPSAPFEVRLARTMTSRATS